MLRAELLSRSPPSCPWNCGNSDGVVGVGIEDFLELGGSYQSELETHRTINAEYMREGVIIPGDTPCDGHRLV